MGTEGETEVDDGRELDEGGDKQDWSCFVGGVWGGEEVEVEVVGGDDTTPVECYS